MITFIFVLYMLICHKTVGLGWYDWTLLPLVAFTNVGIWSARIAEKNKLIKNSIKKIKF